jgi:hypothetical protein
MAGNAYTVTMKKMKDDLLPAAPARREPAKKCGPGRLTPE